MFVYEEGESQWSFVKTNVWSSKNKHPKRVDLRQEWGEESETIFTVVFNQFSNSHFGFVAA